MSSTAASEIRLLVQLSWPVSLGMLGQVGMGTVDTVMIGGLGKGPLSSLAIGNMWAFGVLILALGAMRALDPVVAQAWGASDHGAVRRGLAQGLVMALMLSVPTAFVLLLAGPGLGALGQPDALLPGAAAYCRGLIPGVPFALMFAAGRQFLQAMGRMRPATTVMIAANVANVATNYWFIHGGLGLPPLGVLGCALATSLAHLLTCAGLLWLCRDVWRAWWPGWRLGFAPGPLARLFALGVPAGLQMGLEVWAFIAAGLMMGWLGETELSAHAIALNLASLTFMIPFGVSAAAATRVGNLVGAGRRWQRSGWLAVGLGVGWMALSASALLAFPEPLVRLYNREADVIAMGARLLPIAGAFQLFDGVQVTAFGVLRGAGDVRVPTLANVVGYWLLGLPIGYWLAFREGWGPEGVWVGLAIGLASVAVLLLARIVQIGSRGAVRVNA